MLNSVLTPLILAFVVAIDAFSICLGIGLQPLRLRKILSIGLWIGLFHMVMPLLGLTVGALLTENISIVTELTSGLLLFGLGSHMIFSTFTQKTESTTRTMTSTSIIFLAFSVSLDSFPIGISLGMTGFQTTLTLILFGSVSTSMAWLGLLIGKKIQHNLGPSLTWIGGGILCLFGLHIIF